MQKNIFNKYFAIGVVFTVALVMGAIAYLSNPLLLTLYTGAIIFIAIFVLCIISPETGFLAFIFSLPLERIPSASVGGATVRISQVLLLCLTISLIYNALIKRRFILRISPYFYPYLLMIIGFLASFYEMRDFSRGIQVFVYILFTSLTIWVIPGLVQSKDQLKSIVKVMFISTILISIFGLYQFGGDMIGLPTSLTGLRELYTKRVFGFPRIQATELEPLYLANFLIVPLTLAVTFFIRRIKIYSTRFFIAFIVLVSAVFVLTLARGGYAGLAASMFVAIAASLFWALRPKIVTSALGIGIILAVLAFAFISYSNIGQKSWTEVAKHFTNINQDASALQRFGAYDQAFTAFHQSPVTGVGVGNFGPWVAGYPDQLPPDGWSIVNNETYELLAETGVVGLVTVSIFILLLLFRSFLAIFATKDEFLRALMIGLFAALIGVLIQYQTFSTFYVMQVWTLFALCITTQQIIFREAISSKQ